MRPFSRSLVVMAVAAGLALPAMAMAAPQGDVWVHHDHSKTVPPQSAAPTDSRHDMMARMAALDDRIKTLNADMNMFVGDMKVQTMAKLLTALVERQTMMRDEMISMHGDMMKKMDSMNMGSMKHDNAGPAPQSGDAGMMCASEGTR